MKEQNLHRTQITGFLKDGSKRVIKADGRYNYDAAKKLISDLDGGENILKVELQHI